MSDSVFDSILLRELYGNKLRNQTCAKVLPAFSIEYFECRSSQAFHLHSTLDTNSPPFAGDFSPSQPDLILLAQEDGLVHLYDTSATGINAFVKDYEPHANAVFDVKWLASGSSFLTASGDQSVRLIDAESGIILQQFFGHTMSVRCLSLMPQDTQIFASASRDGSIRIWDIRLKSDTVNFRGIHGTSSVGLLSQCHLPNWSTHTSSESPTSRRPRTPSRRQQTDAQSVTSVVFKNENTLLSAGSTDGSIKMWDLRRIFSVSSQKKAKPKSVLPYRGVSQKRSGFSDLQLNSLRTRLYANCLDNVVYEYDLQNPSTSPVFVYTGHQTDSFYIKLDVSPDDRYIICGSSDRRAHIYAIGQKRQCPVVLSGHNGEVSVPRWCRSDPSRIVTLSDDSQAFVWNMFPARKCILPQPGELAGLAERLAPTEGLMSPSEQDKRIVRSPRSLPNRSTMHTIPSLSTTTTSPSASSARRRQSNIRCFLSSLSPPCPLQSSAGTKQLLSITTSSPACSGPSRLRNPATLTETLGGVVQRFPGLSVGPPTNVVNSTPPLGCYSPGITNTSPSTPTPIRHRRLLSPENFDTSDLENVSPIQPRSIHIQSGLPLDFVDGPLLTKSPIICCTPHHTHTTPVTPETPPASAVKRTPLGLQQALFNTPPQLHAAGQIDPVTVPLPRKRPSIYLDDIHESHNTDTIFLGKRRRLTVYEIGDRRSSTQHTRSPTTPTGRRRRMTTVSTRPLTPITKFFKRDD